ncbi:hypothetical protein P3S68_001301 [Capsicum galapagoense]
MDSGDGSVLKRRTRQQSLKYMVELIQRNRLSQSGNPTSFVNANSGRKRKMAEPSRGDERKNDGRRKSVMKRPLVGERSDDDFLEEESRPNVISIEEELTDSKSSSESEFEASTDENNDEPNDKTYREIESLASNGEESEPRSLAQRSPGGYGSKYFEELLSLLDVDSFRFSDSFAVQDSPIYGDGTIWDLVPLSVRTTMYPHQCGGFEFMGKNLVGDVALERLREPLSDSKRGCITSHPPGTEKTPLTIVFLQSFLKVFPKCRPVIIAPSSLLLNWEAEFQKWEADIPFHNLNNKDLSFQEDEGTVGVFNCLSRAARKDPNLIRMVKLRSWEKKILLKFPVLLVLEDAHTARNEQSLVWKALKEVETEKCIVLSGTPFQNNIKELYNTLCIVSPKFAGDMERKWAFLSSSLEKNSRELRDIISPLVHSCSENVKRVSLAGIRDTVVHVKPTYLQKELLKRIPENPGSFYEQNLASLISVHPSLVEKRKEFSEFES